jgi:hypothetical protein
MQRPHLARISVSHFLKECEIYIGHLKASGNLIAPDIDEAITIAKRNPEFNYVPSASIEVRPIKTKEEKRNFVYPKS